MLSKMWVLDPHGPEIPESVKAIVMSFGRDRDLHNDSFFVLWLGDLSEMVEDGSLKARFNEMYPDASYDDAIDETCEWYKQNIEDEKLLVQYWW